MKIYSYLMCGKPILATEIASHTQVLTPEVAMLVPCDESAMAGGMRTLAGDATLRGMVQPHVVYVDQKHELIRLARNLRAERENPPAKTGR